MPVEREIKCRVATAARARSLLRGIGARPTGPRRFEANLLLDLPGAPLRRGGRLLRLRLYGREWTLTYKGPARRSARAKVREEWETAVADGEAMLRALRGAGFRVTFRYEKWRTPYAAPEIHLLLDETPAGVFVEIEGSQRAIDRAVEAMRIPPADRLVSDYAEIWRSFRRRTGRGGKDMVFR